MTSAQRLKMSSKVNLGSISPILADFRDKAFNSHALLAVVSTQRCPSGDESGAFLLLTDYKVLFIV